MPQIIEYLYTNENLHAIVGGLKITTESRVLCCNASGDQPLALLEKANSILSIAPNPAQIELTRQRRKLIEQRMYPEFLEDIPLHMPTNIYIEPGRNQTHRKHRQEYFSQKGRLERIRSKIKNLELRVGTLEEIEGEFDAIYASNIIGYRQSQSVQDNEKQLELLAQNLKPRGRIYIANGDDITTTLFSNSGIVYDDHASWIAYEANKGKTNWKPAIFTKLLIRC